MVIHKNVRSTVLKSEISYDDDHVYLVKNQKEIKENEGTEYEFIGYEAEEVVEYGKDEFIIALSTGQVALNDKTKLLEDALLEISKVIYN